MASNSITNSSNFPASAIPSVSAFIEAIVTVRFSNYTSAISPSSGFSLSDSTPTSANLSTRGSTSVTDGKGNFDNTFKINRVFFLLGLCKEWVHYICLGQTWKKDAVLNFIQISVFMGPRI